MPVRVRPFLSAAVAAMILAGCTKAEPQQAAATAGRSEGGIVQAGFSSDTAEAAAAGDRVLFAFDSASIDGANVDVVEAMARWYRARPQDTVTIEGHADERGTREYNLALGERRALALRNALTDRGVSPRQIADTVSYGKERPAVAGSSESAWAQNRRAVIVRR